VLSRRRNREVKPGKSNTLSMYFQLVCSVGDEIDEITARFLSCTLATDRVMALVGVAPCSSGFIMFSSSLLKFYYCSLRE
jgi:hypothetical protein